MLPGPVWRMTSCACTLCTTHAMQSMRCTAGGRCCFGPLTLPPAAMRHKVQALSRCVCHVAVATAVLIPTCCPSVAPCVQPAWPHMGPLSLCQAAACAAAAAAAAAPERQCWALPLPLLCCPPAAAAAAACWPPPAASAAPAGKTSTAPGGVAGTGSTLQQFQCACAYNPRTSALAVELCRLLRAGRHITAACMAAASLCACRLCVALCSRAQPCPALLPPGGPCPPGPCHVPGQPLGLAAWHT